MIDTVSGQIFQVYALHFRGMILEIVTFQLKRKKNPHIIRFLRLGLMDSICEFRVSFCMILL